MTKYFKYDIGPIVTIWEMDIVEKKERCVFHSQHGKLGDGLSGCWQDFDYSTTKSIFEDSPNHCMKEISKAELFLEML